MAPGDKAVDMLLEAVNEKVGELGPTSGRSVGGIEHTCVKTLERRGCPGCLDDALAATMGRKRNPPPSQSREGGSPQAIYYKGLAAASDAATKAAVKHTCTSSGGWADCAGCQITAAPLIYSSVKEQVGYREQTCYACGQTLRASPAVVSLAARGAPAYAWLFAACGLSLGSAFGCVLFVPEPDPIRARWALAAMLFAFAATFAIGRWQLLRRP